MRTILKALNRLEEGVLGLGLLGLAVMSFVGVVSRYVFDYSFTWMEEFGRYFCVFLTFLGASLGVKYGMHFSMDFLVTRVPPRAGQLMRLASNIIGAALFSIVAVLAWQHSFKMLKFGTTSAAMGLPMFWAYLPISVFSGTMVLRFLNQCRGHIKGLVSGEPLIPETVKAQDEAEAAAGAGAKGGDAK